MACALAGLAVLFFSPKPSAESLIDGLLPAGAQQLQEERDGPNVLRVYDLPLNYTQADAFYNELFNLSPGDPQVTVRSAIIPGLLDHQTICSATAPGGVPARLILKSTPRTLLTVQISAPKRDEPARLLVICVMAEDRERGRTAFATPVTGFALPAFSFTNATMQSSVASERISAYNLVSESNFDEVANFYRTQTNPIPFKKVSLWTNAPAQSAVFYRLSSNGLDLATFFHQPGSSNSSLQAVQAH